MAKYFLPLILLLAVSCGTSQADNTLKAKTGQSFTVTLKSNPTTGYGWKIASIRPKGIIQMIGSKYTAPSTGLAGAGGVEIWTFKAVKKGAAQIMFSYQRPWEKDIPPIETRNIRIIVCDEKAKK
ncbi:MAG: protease inhibitor I42 family protein [Candidatus Margulisiibacteriota bacterium]